jgi:hypothetical protein
VLGVFGLLGEPHKPKVINFRLMWFIQQINYLSPDQNGFRYQRGTNFSLIKIQFEIENATKSKQTLGMVCLDKSLRYCLETSYYIETPKNLMSRKHA